MFILNRRREKDMLLKSLQQGPWPLYTSAVWVMVEIHLKLSTLLEYSNHVTGWLVTTIAKSESIDSGSLSSHADCVQ